MMTVNISWSDPHYGTWTGFVINSFRDGAGAVFLLVARCDGAIVEVKLTDKIRWM